MSFTIEIIDAKSERKITTLDRVPKTGTIGDVKDRIAKLYSCLLYTSDAADE